MRLPYNDCARDGQSFSKVARFMMRACCRFSAPELRPVKLGSEALLPTSVIRRRVCAANVTTHNPGRLAKALKRPLKIGNREAAALPVRHRLFEAQAIEIDGDVDIFAGDAFRKFFKMLAPIVVQNCAFSLSIPLRSIVCPRMHFKNSGAFRATVPENLVRPPAFEVAATPNTRMPHIWNFQCAIDPPTTSPFRRAHIPVRMIIEGDQDDRFGNMPQPQCSQMVKIAGPIEQEFRRNICLVFPIELFNQRAAARRNAAAVPSFAP